MRAAISLPHIMWWSAVGPMSADSLNQLGKKAMSAWAEERMAKEKHPQALPEACCLGPVEGG